MANEKGIAIRDQAWTSMRSHQEDLERIIEFGPTQEGDIQIIRKAMLLVAGDLHFKQAEILDAGGD